ncbi:hypothetical protein FRUB_09390 [Fimbriiglobus ruber]|uniref:RedB protein n=2 Tax=Fimbriiglobus ruber TaxID=1908690 RepID=A0A225DL12_9BACT|nr:hypothetical protein FRUB_09390 [Fimbriiglobus ruber]
MIRCGHDFFVRALVVVWAVGVGVGFYAWERYDRTPGPGVETAGVPVAPVASAEPFTIELFAHPRCPCTRASLMVLAEVLAAAPGIADVRVVFVRPAGTPAGWERTDLWDAAVCLPGARVSCDAEGEVARRAGAVTSGQVNVYDRGGRVVFSGGITAARGRAGDSPGRREVVRALAGLEPTLSSAPVFGCPLIGPAGCSVGPPGVCE